MTLIIGLIEHPWLRLLWFGPVLWIGVAAFEEVLRVFVLTRLSALWPGGAGRWGAVILSTALAGMTHAYQGPAGIISTGLMGLIAALFYLRRGRIWPLIVSHALYDAWSVGLGMAAVAYTMR